MFAILFLAHFCIIFIYMIREIIIVTPYYYPYFYNSHIAFYIIFYAAFFHRLSPVSPSATDGFFF